MIPKNIHLIFLRKDEPFPELFEKCKQEIQVNHPDWNIRLYNKDDACLLYTSPSPRDTR